MEVDFLFSNELVNEVEKLIRNSDKCLLLVSPFIDLDSRIQDALAEKIKKTDFELKVLFGKNKGNPYKSVKKDSFDFLMKFPNIEIRYNDRLHAKFYQNDSHYLMTSMNLYDYSLAKNIEVGIIGRHGSKSPLGKFADKTGSVIDKGVSSISENVLGISNAVVNPIEKFRTIFESSELKYRTEPIMKKKGGLRGFVGGEKMEGFTVLEDTLSTHQKPNTVQETSVVQDSKAEQKPRVVEGPRKTEKSNKLELKSASQLSKLLGVSLNEITKAMEQKGFINDGQITDAGESNGLVLKKYMGNEYIAYPKEIIEKEFVKN